MVGPCKQVLGHTGRTLQAGPRSHWSDPASRSSVTLVGPCKQVLGHTGRTLQAGPPKENVVARSAVYEKGNFWIRVCEVFFYPATRLLGRRHYVNLDSIVIEGPALLVANHISHLD